MSDNEPELRRMLELYKQERSPAAESESRVWAAVEASVQGAAHGGSSEHARNGASGTPRAGVLATGAKLLVVGLVIAAGAVLWLRATPSQRAAAPRPTPIAAEALTAPAAEAKLPAESAPQPVAAAVPVPAAVPVVAPPAAVEHAKTAGSSLSAELALVRAAQAALDAGRNARALALLDRHARRFPEGALAEERAAAQVEALCGLGRREQARRAAAAFTARFAGSPRTARVAALCSDQAQP